MSQKNFENLIQWSKDHFSELPWRNGRTVYRTLVSEIMLQQTTVGTVKNHFERFLKKFPTLESLAQASEEQLLIEWKGLGYYRRAKNLRKIAIGLMDIFGGKFPKTEEELLKLNGVGAYTANALLAIGMDQKALAVDANLERVISRLFAIEEMKGPKLTKLIHAQFKENKILNFKNISYRDLNEALMDLGRVYCKANTVECQNCPLSSNCSAFKSREQLKYPVQDKKVKQFFELELVRVVVTKGQKVLAYQKNDNEWLHGQWELPTIVINSQDEKLEQYPQLKKKIKVDNLKKYKTSITKYKITNYVSVMTFEEFKKLGIKKDFEFVKIDGSGNLSTASHKALNYC